MPYIGKGANGFGIRETFQYTATSGQTAFTGSDINSKTLSFDNGSLVDVLLNGITLKPTTDYNTSTANTITLTSGASASDEIMIIVYDVFSLSDAMPKTGGTFTGAVTHTGAFTSVGIDDNADATAITINSSEQVGIGTTSPSSVLHVNSASGNSAVTFQTANNGSSVSSNYITPNRTYYTGVDIGGVNSAYTIYDGNASAERFKLDSSGNVTVNSGNLVIGTSGKGIDFSATTDASGMTSELLDSYETGTFTPTITGMTSISYNNNTGKYTKIGNNVHIQVFIRFTGTASTILRIAGLPFTSGADGETFFPSYQSCESGVVAVGYVPGSTTQIDMYEANAGATQWHCPSVSGQWIIGSGSYTST